MVQVEAEVEGGFHMQVEAGDLEAADEKEGLLDSNQQAPLVEPPKHHERLELLVALVAEVCSIQKEEHLVVEAEQLLLPSDFWKQVSEWLRPYKMVPAAWSSAKLHEDSP